MAPSSSINSTVSAPVSENEIEKATENDGEEASSPAPDGGLKAWLVVVGGFFTYFATFDESSTSLHMKLLEGRRLTSLLNTFGIFQVYYEEHMLKDKSSSMISWIGSIQLFILFFGGLIFGPIFDTHGAKILLIPGTIIYTLSLMLTSLCTEYYQFILAQGVLFGIGDAMVFYPTISAISHWFDKKRGLVLGIVVAGCSSGGIAWPLLLPKLFDEVGFAWATRIAGFICLALLIPSCLFIVPRLPPRHSDLGGDIFKVMFRDKGYIVFVGSMFFVLWGLFVPFYYIPLYGLAHNMSHFMANNLVVTLNAGSLAGRILSGLTADKLGRFNITCISALVNGILVLCLHSIKSEAGIIAFSVIYGFFSGGLISLQNACVAQITEKKDTIGIRIGFMMAVCAIGALTGNPIGGALISSEDGGFGGLIDFSGLVLLAGAFLAIYARIIMQPMWLTRF